MAAPQELADLVARVALGDRQAFRRLYEATAPSLLGVALRLLRDRGRAEDVIQEAFVSVWHRAGGFRASASAPMTWLTAIVRNRALDTLRSDARHDADPLVDDEDEDEDAAREVEDDRPEPLGLLTQAADALAVRACLEAIDGSQRQCLALAYYHGLTHAEMAAHLGSPIGSVKAWLRRGLEKLRRCLERAK
ncbi:MAG: sigma-70 family RNA polymerase sigma factor [Burkholderiales bacterium]|jgi:RNA polymerase sigma-70 factor, ECF subfamily|nr:sigma-70 family RNA polymerase sigma factor [Burkholderiales bacterium]